MVVLWVASLFKILHESFSASQVEVLNDGGVFCKRNVLLVIAHPDDESIEASILGLCFPLQIVLNIVGKKDRNSRCNADGIGNIRKEELYLASTVLKVPQKQVKVLDHPDLQDGFGKSWNSKLLSKIIKEEIVNCAIDLVITFDNYGVSGHCNHQDVHQGVRKNETYLEALDLWEAVEEDYDVPLPDNPTVAQIKSHKEKKIRKSKAKSTLFASVSPTISTRIMAFKSAKEI
ncbi:putative DDB1- and CUL4-associated factor -like protein 1-like isoform X1 [Capsicum annuum]|nr:putative DDB1- and CUL4-associated factor -like protein 1-like isoform X1 [Capsicum annuum]